MGNCGRILLNVLYLLNWLTESDRIFSIFAKIYLELLSWPIISPILTIIESKIPCEMFLYLACVMTLTFSVHVFSGHHCWPLIGFPTCLASAPDFLAYCDSSPWEFRKMHYKMSIYKKWIWSISYLSSMRLNLFQCQLQWIFRVDDPL